MFGRRFCTEIESSVLLNIILSNLPETREGRKQGIGTDLFQFAALQFLWRRPIKLIVNSAQKYPIRIDNSGLIRAQKNFNNTNSNNRAKTNRTLRNFIEIEDSANRIGSEAIGLEERPLILQNNPVGAAVCTCTCNSVQ